MIEILATSDGILRDTSWLHRISQFLQEYGPQILKLTGHHLLLSFLAIAIACALAIPLAILLTWIRKKWISNAVLGLAGMIQPIPSLALVALAGAVFLAMGLRTIGIWPGLVALVAYAVLPVLRNTYTGIDQVDPTIVEVARGMGMTNTQIMLKVKLPLALPVIMAGIRIAMVWTIGVATLVSLIGAKSLGILIFRGLDGNKPLLMLGGAIPAVVLALAMDGVLSLLEKLMTPRGMNLKSDAGR